MHSVLFVLECSDEPGSAAYNRWRALAEQFSEQTLWSGTSATIIAPGVLSFAFAGGTRDLALAMQMASDRQLGYRLMFSEESPAWVRSKP